MKYGVSSRAGNEPLQRLTILLVTQFNVHLPWVNTRLAWHLNRFLNVKILVVAFNQEEAPAQ